MTTPNMQRAGAAAKKRDPRAGRTPISGKRPAPKAAPAADPQPRATEPAKPARAPKKAVDESRPPGTIRVVGDVNSELAAPFKQRVRANRWTNSLALAVALRLLEDLSDEEYNSMLQREFIAQRGAPRAS